MELVSLEDSVEQLRRTASVEQLDSADKAAFQGVFATQGCMMVKETLALRGFDVGPCRAPMGSVPEAVGQRYANLLDALGFPA